MRTLKTENEKLKRIKENKPNLDRTKKQHEEETGTRDEKLRRAEKDKKTLTNNVAELVEQIDNLKREASNKYERATTTSKESNKKIKDLKEENENRRET